MTKRVERRRPSPWLRQANAMLSWAFLILFLRLFGITPSYAGAIFLATGAIACFVVSSVKDEPGQDKYK